MTERVAEESPRMPEGHGEDYRRKVIRELIMHENELTHQRRSHLTVLQGFLFATAGLLMQMDSEANNYRNSVLIYVVAGVGALLAVEEVLALRLPALAIKELLPSNHRDPTPVIGLHGLRPEGDYALIDKISHFLNGYPVVPFILMATWVAFALSVRFIPSEN